MVKSAVIFQRTYALTEIVNQQLYEESIHLNSKYLKAESVFSFKLFPDTLSIDSSKITISKRHFLVSEYITIPFNDISDVAVHTALFFATITITYIPQAVAPMLNQPVIIKIANLKHKDAIKAKDIINRVCGTRALHRFEESNRVI